MKIDLRFWVVAILACLCIHGSHGRSGRSYNPWTRAVCKQENFEDKYCEEGDFQVR